MKTKLILFFRLEIESLKNDNNRQQQLIGINSATILAKGGDDMVTKIGQENTVCLLVFLLKQISGVLLIMTFRSLISFIF